MHMVGLLGCPEQGQELDSVIFVDPFQLRTGFCFWDATPAPPKPAQGLPWSLPCPLRAVSVVPEHLSKDQEVLKFFFDSFPPLSGFGFGVGSISPHSYLSQKANGECIIFPHFFPGSLLFFSNLKHFLNPICVCAETAELEYSAGDGEQMLSRGINNHQSGRISFLKSKIIPECIFGDGAAAAGASLSQGGVWGGCCGFGFWIHSSSQR